MSDEQQFTDIMVDIETTDTAPDRGAILQIAAVRFNAKTGEVDHNYFEACLSIPAHRRWDESTRAWWSKQKPSVLRDIMQRAQPWRDVMRAFLDWTVQTKSPVFWGKPTHFDFSFIASYFKDADLPMPYHYRKANDQNSFIRGLWFPQDPPNLEAELEFVGDAHNAIWDTFHQVKVVLEHIKQHKDRALVGDILPPTINIMNSQPGHCGQDAVVEGKVVDADYAEQN